jgi:hypothetical protein
MASASKFQDLLWHPVFRQAIMQCASSDEDMRLKLVGTFNYIQQHYLKDGDVSSPEQVGTIRRLLTSSLGQHGKKAGPQNRCESLLRLVDVPAGPLDAWALRSCYAQTMIPGVDPSAPKRTSDRDLYSWLLSTLAHYRVGALIARQPSTSLDLLTAWFLRPLPAHSTTAILEASRDHVAVAPLGGRVQDYVDVMRDLNLLRETSINPDSAVYAALSASLPALSAWFPRRHIPPLMEALMHRRVQNGRTMYPVGELPEPEAVSGAPPLEVQVLKTCLRLPSDAPELTSLQRAWQAYAASSPLNDRKTNSGLDKRLIAVPEQERLKEAIFAATNRLINGSTGATTNVLDPKAFSRIVAIMSYIQTFHLALVHHGVSSPFLCLDAFVRLWLRKLESTVDLAAVTAQRALSKGWSADLEVAYQGATYRICTYSTGKQVYVVQLGSVLQIFCPRNISIRHGQQILEHLQQQQQVHPMNWTPFISYLRSLP